MAEDNPELQAKLRELDLELEDGDITRKGYEKRRTVLLSQYLGPGATNPLLRIQSPNDAIQSPGDGSRSASLAALNGAQTHETYTPYNGNMLHTSQPSSIRSGRGASGEHRAEYPPSHVDRFQETQLGVRKHSSSGDSMFLPRPGSAGSNYDTSRTNTMAKSEYAFNPLTGGAGYATPEGQSRLSTMLDSQQYFSDFTGQQNPEPQRESYGGPQRYSNADPLSPEAMYGHADFPSAGLMIDHQMPLEPRDVPFAVYDPHNGNVPMSKFDNIGAVLRYRGQTNAKQPAYWVLDPKGKETASITWEKLASRAEKVAQVIRDKSNLYRGDRVALIYRDSEIIDFAVALMGCFIAGVVAVPINNVDDYHKLSLLLTTTQAHLALTTDNNLKAFHRDITAQKLKWPTGVEWWKTNEFGSYHPKRKDETPPSQVPDLAYIEFSRAPTGDLRGVVLSHRTIMHQMACLSAIISSIPVTKTETLRAPGGAFIGSTNRHHEIILSYLDPREGAGLIFGVLLGVYGGHTTVWLESKSVETPGLYAHLITKYRTTIMVADYPGLKQAAYNYQQDPMSTRNFKKNLEPNFSSVKICLIDTLTVDCEFHEILADRWLRPMRNPKAWELVAPMLCLPEHGGMVISVRDWLGGEERMGCPLSMDDEGSTPHEKRIEDSGNETQKVYKSLIGGSGGAGVAKKTMKPKSRTELSEVLLDKEALKTNEVLVLAKGEEAKKRANEPGTVRAGAFGYPIPDATLALVDPETSLLCSPFSIGEIWVDSPSLSGGFWALPKHTETIFHARPYKFEEGNPNPIPVEPEFLRTGLLGCIIEGKIFVLGLYEDRIRQRVQWTEHTEHGLQEAEHRYFFVQHLVLSIVKNVPKIYDCSAFDTHVNGEYLPIILLETQAASTAPINPGGPPRQLDIPFLDTLSERCIEVLYQEHHLRVYCVMITAPNTLPRVVKNGRREIGNMLCRKEFDNGSLPCVHVKFGVERAVQNLPLGEDPAGGIWSPLSGQIREEMLFNQEKQYSGVDHREVTMDDRTSTPLNSFTNIFDLLQWRVTRQAEELAYCTVDGRGKEGKGINWKKLDLKTASVAVYLKNKVKLQAGDRALLMYTHSEDFVFAIHACFCIGVVAIPMGPLDQNRLNEDAPALLHMIADFKIKAILVNHDVDSLLKQKPVSQHLKQSALVLKVNIPHFYNTSKPTKVGNGCRHLGLTMKPAWVQPGYAALVWVYWTPDQRRVAVQLGHNTIMALCKVQKETCQMTSTRPVLGCVRSTMGLGFLHTCLMGIYLAAPTYLVSPVDFAANPVSLFLTLSRYKIKDTYATAQMLDHAMANMAGKGFSLIELKNLMIATDTRPRTDIYQKTCAHFAATGLERTSINTIYSHVLNPMIASRSYMCIEPIELYLDIHALRRGLVVPTSPEICPPPHSLLVQDSGMVPVSTQIAIVNPESNRLCHVGEFGEIWVQSQANAASYYGSKDVFDAEKFNGRTVDGDPGVQYMRTGDLGFLHSLRRPIGPGGGVVEMQALFVLGCIGETIEVNGLSHFPVDIEGSVERCHRNIVPNGSAVFLAGGLVVLVVEVVRKNFLTSIVPVIVNAVLNEHQLVVDIVAFVSKGDFPRSRLGEKQRGKILASWVTRKMQSIAQFGIRDPEGDMLGTGVPDSRGSGIGGVPVGARSSTKGTIGGAGSVKGGSSLKQVESGTTLAEEPRSYDAISPIGAPDKPAHYNDSIAESPPGVQEEAEAEMMTRSNITPTPAMGDRKFSLAQSHDHGFDFTSDLPAAGFHPASAAGRLLNTTTDYSPVEMNQGFYFQERSPPRNFRDDGRGNRALAEHEQQDEHPVPTYSNKPYLDDAAGEQSWIMDESSVDEWTDGQDDSESTAGRTPERRGGGVGGARLRVANRTEESESEDEHSGWARDAIRHISLAER